LQFAPHPNHKEDEPIRKLRILTFIPLSIWMIFIFTLSSQPYQKQSIQPYLQQVDQNKLKNALPSVTIKYRTSTIHAKSDPYRFVEFIFRKSAHLFMYAMLAVWAYVASIPYRFRRGWKAVAILAFVLLIAVLDEWNQSFGGERTSAIQDVWIDMIGGVIGLLVASLLAYWRQRKTYRPSNADSQSEKG